MPESADLRLIERCKAGDEAAFADLVDRHKDLVYGLICRVLGDRERADDLAQEVFLRVHRGLPYFRGEASLTTWIFRIVLNLCAQARARRQPDLSLDETDSAGRRHPEPSRIDRAYDDLELRDRLDKAMAQLPDTHRVLVAAHYLEGVLYETLADALGMPLGTVKTTLYRAKRRLREILEAE